MTDNDSSQPKGRRQSQDEGAPPSLMLIALGVLALVFLASAALGSVAAPGLSIDEFRSQLESNEFEKIAFRDTSCEVVYRVGDLKNEARPRRQRLNFINDENAAHYVELVQSAKARDPKITTKVYTLQASADQRALVYFVTTILIFVAFYYFLLRPLRPGAGILNFGKSNHQNVADRTGVKLADVAGVEEAKAEVVEIVEYLRTPEKFRRLGARIPKGVLLVGPPGTGKTLLAKATAGEAGVAFFATSGSDFVEMFAGVGASRVRDLFRNARENSPCILFLDEIDAVGRQRSASFGSHEERDQTLNQILVEMDGFSTGTTVIVMAATNRADILDKALLRPGRFDRKITLDLPDVKGRLAILSVHAKKVKLAEGVDLEILARATPGFSGAELEACINEAALAAALKDSEAINQEHLEEARDKVRWGRQKQGRVFAQDELEATAWHEAGHTLLGLRLKYCDPVHKVTIIPRGLALGATMSLPERDVVGLRQKQVLDKIAMCFGGRIAEELVTSDLSTGAANDLEQATALARHMVTAWGMSPALGTASFVERGEGPFGERSYSEDTARRIDQEIQRILNEEFERARGILLTERDALSRIAQGLLRFETINGEEARRLADGCAVDALRPAPVQTEAASGSAQDQRPAAGREAGEESSPPESGEAPA